MALWDIRKAFGAPVHQLPGAWRVITSMLRRASGASSAGQRGGGGFVRVRGPGACELAQATMEAGFRCFRMDASVGGPIANQVSNTNERVSLVVAACARARRRA
jgi:L-alanine-DL-glutamate epimerase-like enolase superfamily enzyme